MILAYLELHPAATESFFSIRWFGLVLHMYAHPGGFTLYFCVTHDCSENSKPAFHGESGALWEILLPFSTGNGGKLVPSKPLIFLILRTVFMLHPYLWRIKNIFHKKVQFFNTFHTSDLEIHSFKVSWAVMLKKHPWFLQSRTILS